MKKLLFVTMFCTGLACAMQAQNPTKATTENYEHMLRNERQMDFREYAVQTLGLSSEQITAFDPLYREYMQEKNALAGKKVELLEKYSKEIAEENTAEKKDEEVGDFIEDYWEIEIKEMELEKNYFDKLEDKITADHAFAFFMLEDIAESDIERRFIEKRYVPIIIEVEKTNMNTGAANKNMADMKHKTDIDAYSKWMTGQTGKESHNHQYTHDGLMNLSAAVTALGNACGSNVTLTDKRNRIHQLADNLTKDPKSNMHSNWAREAFILSAEMMKTVQQQCGNMSASMNAVNQLDEAARKMDAGKPMLQQEQAVYNFFQKAQAAVNDMSGRITWSNK